MNTVRTLYRTTAEISAILTVPVGTLHRWASEDQWRRTPNQRRPVLYVFEDACASYDRRKEARAETLANQEFGRERRLAS